MFESIQKELRKPAHYLSMRKREQAANCIDDLQAQIEALTQAIVERDSILKQYIERAAARSFKA